MPSRQTAGVSSNSAADAAMDRYAAGDRSAFSPLYVALAPRLHAYLLRQTRNRALAADILQETLIHMHEARASFASGSQVTPWCIAIARRIVIDHTRQAQREVLCEPGAVEWEDLPSCQIAPDEECEMRELMGQAQRELERLPRRQLVAYHLVTQKGLTLNEAAQVLGTSVGAVKLRVHRANEAIRSAIRRGDDTLDERGPQQAQRALGLGRGRSTVRTA
jgi:RNA polymerase sigma-70 factor (ECF subfamily)